jgi:predicted DCC family thiol-disulfide oxidoreductase YuxK
MGSGVDRAPDRPAQGGPLEVYYDGACPLCTREMQALRRRDRRGRIRWVDFTAPGFDAAAAGLSSQALADRIHARLPDGAVVEGVEVFRRIGARLGLGWLVAPSRLPGVRQLLDLAYRLIARNRPGAHRGSTRP